MERHGRSRLKATFVKRIDFAYVGTMKTFENKTVLVTGGTSGIGKATAIAFSREGANVVVSGRRVAEGKNVAGGDRLSRWKGLICAD